jgi:hypothetical protein
MNKKLATICCPVCSGEMQIRELECSSCNIQVRGHFGRGSRFDQLNPDQAAFLETFIRCRGVLRDVEASLGISYPTVRARLDALLVALDVNEVPAVEQSKEEPTKQRSLQRKEILAALDAGTMDAASALEALNNLK